MAWLWALRLTLLLLLASRPAAAYLIGGAPTAAGAPPCHQTSPVDQQSLAGQQGNSPSTFQHFACMQHCTTPTPVTLLFFIPCLQDDVQHVRSAYDAFLAEFPLCYGYWKRYAEAERRHGSTDAAAAVYERGVAATPYSTELWVAYVSLLLATDAETETVHRCGTAYAAY
jgi:hypothetical protein